MRNLLAMKLARDSLAGTKTWASWRGNSSPTGSRLRRRRASWRELRGWRRWASWPRGAELGITEFTVKVDRHHMMEKMRAGSIAEPVRMAQRLGLAGGKGG